MLIGVLIGLSAVPRFDKLNFASLPAGGRALIGVAMAVGIVAGVGALILLLGYGFKGAVIGMAASVGVAAVLYVISRQGVARN
ncbi:MAG: hypothetical protein ACJ8FS_09630 [Sphingomicrobium sp.]